MMHAAKFSGGDKSCVVVGAVNHRESIRLDWPLKTQ